MKKKTLEELLEKRKTESYADQYEYIIQLIDEKKIKPVKKSVLNGKKPALHTEYRIVEQKKDYSDYMDELRFRINPAISADYYLSHPDVYELERSEVLKLSDFLQNRRERLGTRISYNERSFEIWGREKFLTGESGNKVKNGGMREGSGKRVLKHCGLSEDFLNCYVTAEPFAYYARNRDTPQNILIIENKDTFFSMRRYLLGGNASILGENIGTLVYGAGKRVISSFQEFDISAEPYMKISGNNMLYFGDLDYEGIVIYERLESVIQNSGRTITPFKAAYTAMLKKAADIHKLPYTKDNQNRNISELFFSYFDCKTADRIKELLEQDRYIPQEILNISDF